MTTVEAPYVDPGPRSGPPDALVLDIGGDAGALVVQAPPDWIGAEVDVTAVGEPRSHHRHLMVRRLRTPGGEVIAGVLPSLPAGGYTIWAPSGMAIMRVHVAVGEVTTVDCRTARP